MGFRSLSPHVWPIYAPWMAASLGMSILLVALPIWLLSGGHGYVVTSVVAVAGQDVLALAFVPTSLDVPGGRLELVSGSGTNTARVLEWPGRGPGRQAV